MPEPRPPKKSDVFIVDNSDETWKAQEYLAEWCELSERFDIATGFFEIGALLSLENDWQKLKKIRILMGDQVSRRTKQAFNEGLKKITSKLDQSIEEEKRDNDFLEGVPAIVKGIRDNVIECRVYKPKKFHAKAYITHPKVSVIGPTALVGSSNFTLPGLTENVELNIQVRSEVDELQEWFEKHWKDAEPVKEEILKTIQRHTKEYSPFEVYVKSLYEFFKGHEMTEGEWERNQSKIFPILDQYQRDGYQNLMKIASRYNGAFLCDGVGLGKTYIGLMLIERLLLRENKRVVLVVPKSIKSTWKAKIRKFMPGILGGFMPFKIITHTDITREAGEWPAIIENIKEQAEVLIIDEAHHFRNRDTNRYEAMYEIAKNKKIFMLTATPVNNTLFDILHQIELFTRRDDRYFSDAPLGIHSLRGRFIKLEKEIQRRVSSDGDEGINIDADEAQEVLAMDDLFNAIVVQRSRKYVKESQKKLGGQEILFPDREPPTVIDYSIEETYGTLLDNLKEAFNKKDPLLSLPIYYPYAYYKGPDETIDPLKEGRQKQVVGLIRTLLLKRFESSRQAFEFSCEDLLMRLLAFVKTHNEQLCHRWEKQNKNVLEHIRQHLIEREKIDPEEAEDDYLPAELLQKTEDLSEEEFDIDKIVNETLLDMDQLVVFIKDLMKIKGQRDDKLEQLVTKLRENPLLNKHKVIIFTEYMTTARYIYNELKSRGFQHVEEIDGQTSRSRDDIINCFSPYYNDLSTGELHEQGKEEIRILISTDVLAEGLNLQDASLIINYDLHWNPVRLMQRIGRIDRRLDSEVEQKIIQDHPERAEIRGTVHYLNFLPPKELNDILTLYEKVTSKTLKISKTFGIEGEHLLTPEDEWEALKEFNEKYEGTTTKVEEMHLDYQEILKENPELSNVLPDFPLKIFSGKEHISPDAKAVFFCYRLPGKNAETGEWTEDASITRWYLYDLETDDIMDTETEIVEYIRCEKDTPRRKTIPKETLKEIREKMDKHIKNTYLKKVQAPIGIQQELKAWMELS